jgi:hypothetical protein
MSQQERNAGWPSAVTTFPLSVSTIFKDYTRLPDDAGHVFYHYTNRVGVEGILRSGGLRATYRMTMNDPGEFSYARDLIFESLNVLAAEDELPRVAQSLTTYTRKNLEQFLDDSVNMSSAYCACLTVNPDDSDQWINYAENGEGFAIGFNLHRFLKLQVPKVTNGQPYVFCAPVTYEPGKQRDLVFRSVKAGIADLQRFADTCSKRSEDLMALLDRVTQKIVVHLFTLIDFIKAPAYARERELRLMLDPNDGTLRAPSVQRYERNGDSISFIFMNLINPITRRLILSEIRIGPSAAFAKEQCYLHDLLDELGYGSVGYQDRPNIVRSQLEA